MRRHAAVKDRSMQLFSKKHRSAISIKLTEMINFDKFILQMIKNDKSE